MMSALEVQETELALQGKKLKCPKYIWIYLKQEIEITLRVVSFR